MSGSVVVFTEKDVKKLASRGIRVEDDAQPGTYLFFGSHECFQAEAELLKLAYAYMNARKAKPQSMDELRPILAAKKEFYVALHGKNSRIAIRAIFEKNAADRIVEDIAKEAEKGRNMTSLLESEETPEIREALVAEGYTLKTFDNKDFFVHW